MAIPTKGVRNIRTMSGKVDRVAVSYRAYMQITCLEIEKARRGMERNSASQRVAEIDARFREIEKEKGRIIEAISKADTDPSVRAPGAAGGSDSRRNVDGFKIRY